MIKSIIVDDERLARQLIRSLLRDIEDIDIVAEASDGSSAIDVINEKKPDLIFLDIQMPGMSGFEVLEKIRPDLMPYVIFITAYDQYAIKAFEMHALDYLLKPFEKERLYESVNRARKIMNQKELVDLTKKIIKIAQSHRDKRFVDPSLHAETDSLLSLPPITIREGKRLFGLKPSEIVWIKAENQYVKVHTITGSHLVSQSLKSFHSKLSPQVFYRIHRSTVVNVNFIKEITTDKHGTYAILLSTGHRLKLSRGKRDILKEILKHPNHIQ